MTLIQPRNSIASLTTHNREAHKHSTPTWQPTTSAVPQLSIHQAPVSFQRPRSSPEPRHLHWRGWLHLWLWPAPCFLQAPSRTQHNTRARSRRGIMVASDTALSRGAIAIRSRWSDRQRSVRPPSVPALHIRVRVRGGSLEQPPAKSPPICRPKEEGGAAGVARPPTPYISLSNLLQTPHVNMQRTQADVNAGLLTPPPAVLPKQEATDAGDPRLDATDGCGGPPT